MYGLEQLKRMNAYEFHKFQADRYLRMADKQFAKGNVPLANKWMTRRQEHLKRLPENHGNC